MSAEGLDPRPLTMQPELRVTVRRDGLVRAVSWHPGLVAWGPSATLLHGRTAAGVTIADAEIVRADIDDDDDEDEFSEDGPVIELVLDVLAGGDEDALEAIVEWAARIGYERVWLPTGVVDLDGIAPEGSMQTRCTACHVRLVDGGRAFWGWVRTRGHYPTMCCLCGGDLPQWRPVRARRRTPVGLVAREASGEIVELPVSERRAG